MLKPLDPSAAGRPQREALPADAVNNVFKVLHGFYGNLFLSKFASGALDENGDDKGIVSARQVWGHGLREFDVSTIKAALSRCIERHPEYPPSMPQFVALCVSCQVREVYKPERLALPMSGALRSRYVAEARARLEKARASMVERETGYIPLPRNLIGLKQAIGRAVACAGGDEAATLRRLDLMLAPRKAAA